MEQNKAHWVLHWYSNTCSNCGYTAGDRYNSGRTNFCPSCGLEMDEENYDLYGMPIVKLKCGIKVPKGRNCLNCNQIDGISISSEQEIESDLDTLKNFYRLAIGNCIQFNKSVFGIMIYNEKTDDLQAYFEKIIKFQKCEECLKNIQN